MTLWLCCRLGIWCPSWSDSCPLPVSLCLLNRFCSQHAKLSQCPLLLQNSDNLSLCLNRTEWHPKTLISFTKDLHQSSLENPPACPRAGPPSWLVSRFVCLYVFVSVFVLDCISSEEEAIASKASVMHVCRSICLFVCPKQQKTKPIDKYLFWYLYIHKSDV